MFISVNRKQNNAIDIFDIYKFKEYIKENFKINLNEKTSILVGNIYNDLLTDIGVISFGKLNKWISKKFNFKYKNILQKEFWIERGFSIEDYNSI